MQTDADCRLAHGQIDRIGGAAILTFIAEGKPAYRSSKPIKDARAGVESVLRWIASEKSGVDEITTIGDIEAVGHRVVHGGEKFMASAVIDDEVLTAIEDCIDLAPLHNPANIKGILASREILGPGVPQVAVFDTAFHQSLPEHAFLYAIPYQMYRRHKIRRYGFHGTSHRYIAYRYRKIQNIERDNVNIITIHLGNGCSIAAIKQGNSVDTSMGFTPLEGLVMGTRSGDVDPAIVEFICAKEGLSVVDAEMLLNRQSGLLGVSGLTNDMRELIAEAEENNDRRAKLAIDIFCYRVSKYIGAYLAAMNGADGIVFSGGIGENSPYIRSRICSRLEWLGITIDPVLNERCLDYKSGVISQHGQAPAIHVIPTNEELLIARDTVRLIQD